MRARHHLLLYAALLAVAVVALVVALGQGTSNQHIVNRAQGNLKQRAVEAQNLSANFTPNAACNPAIGQGKLGVCAPQTGPSAALAKAAGDPFSIGGILGVDVSSYQGCHNTFAGLSFVIYKLNESTGYRDPCAQHNAATARARHIGQGGYDFLRPGRTSASSEAAVFVGQYRATRTRGVAVADVEANAGLSKAGVCSYVRNWVRYVHGHLPAATIVVYTGAWFWNPQVACQPGTTNLWISAYASRYYVPAGFRSALAWQYSDGVFGPFPHLNGWDSDVFLGSRPRFNRTFGLVAVKPPPSKHAQALCREYAHYRREVKAHTFPESRRARANAVRTALVKAHYRCTTKGKAVRK